MAVRKPGNTLYVLFMALMILLLVAGVALFIFGSVTNTPTPPVIRLPNSRPTAALRWLHG